MERKPGFLSKIIYHSYFHEGKGEDLALPQSGTKLFFFLLMTYPWKLILLNLLSLLLCLPLFTIPATMAALSRVCFKLAVQGYCDIFGEFFGEWKKNLARYLPFFLLTGAPAALSAMLVYRGFGETSGVGGYVFMALCALIFLFVYLIWCYAFPLFAYVDLSVAQNVRNALYFVFTQLRANAVLLIVPLGVSLALILLLPYTVPLFLLCHFSIMALLICCAVKPALCRYAVISEKDEPNEPQA